ncbi:HsdR family type I site-specific deoxyribonuclease [Mycoplasmopsis cynos]|uniref:HsdR family type I site-specific deoxyribonuclease n=1 Tax=Mycoplasmopsis cynos TaxID=171284 RepID=UPI002AFFD26B|nr:HsdR family type I site-specific deoxyribonuclease [Mycoplasmopsis cynos]WQQ15727.1 HsdR family type I site-specific deoxyribonuclease [Mycoplasmopsis cynos]
MSKLNFNNVNFKNEAEFEESVTKLLLDNGWKNRSFGELNIDNELNNVTEYDLKLNWLRILNYNNVDKLDGKPITEKELDLLINEIESKQNVAQVNSDIIKPNQGLQLKREQKIIPLTLIHKEQLNNDGGKNYFQIARQVRINNSNNVQKRSDIFLLINGIPFIHIELKDADKNIVNAKNQLANYNKNIYNGIFKFIHIVVAMNPLKMEYSPRNRELKFINWYDETNKNEINNWVDVVKNFLSIPMALELICDYTIPDGNELKILRSYQYYAVKKILDKIKKTDLFAAENDEPIKGGFIWHATGSGKTFTSFKTSSLIIDHNLADLVIFVADRIELVDQTYNEFVKHNKMVTNVSSTKDLQNKTRKNEHQPIIVTSIQKLDRIKEEHKDILDKKRIVLIFDEAHRSTFGQMMSKIKNTFNKKTIIFGFTGTPIFDETPNTYDIFGEKLHSYTLGDAIVQEKVLKFSCKYNIFEDLYKWAFNCNVEYNRKYCSDTLNSLNSTELKQELSELKNNVKYEVTKKIEEFNEKSDNLDKLIELEKEINYIYKTDLYKNLVVESILNDWYDLEKSKDFKYKFSSILATSSIDDAIKYFRIFNNYINNLDINDKKRKFKFTALFTKSLDSDESPQKLEKLEEIFKEIYKKYEQDFGSKIINQNEEHELFKKDVSQRLKRINIDENDDSKALNLLIVVNQMLTGFDSKYIQTVYFDKFQESQNLVQSVSRTNRKYDINKEFGRAHFYKLPYHMKKNVEEAFRKYAYENLTEITVSDISVLINVIKSKYKEVEKLFKELNISWFKNIESFDTDDINKIVSLRKSYNHLCEIKRIMNSLNLLSFKWEENGKLMPFDQEVAKRIDVKIYEIGSILANIDSTNCGNPLDDDLKFYNDEVLRDIQARKKQELYDKDFFANLEWELRTCESISLVLSKYCIKYHNWIKEWYNLYRNNDKISLYDFLELKKQEDKQEILDELAIYGIGKEIVDEFINNYYIDIEEDINKNNNFEDHIWSKVKSSNGPKYKLRNPIIELIKQYKEK